MPFSTKHFAFGLSTALLALATNSCGGDTELVVQPHTVATDGGPDASALVGPGQTPHVPTTPAHPLNLALPKSQPTGGGAPSSHPVVLPTVH